MADDVILNKAEIIEKCIKRILEEYQGNSANLTNNQTKQDAIILNLERACQAAIDIAMRVVRLKRLGLPKESREAFFLLNAAGVLPHELMLSMYGLVGFRNTAIHNYKELDLDIVEAVITKHLGDFQALVKACLAVS